MQTNKNRRVREHGFYVKTQQKGIMCERSTNIARNLDKAVPVVVEFGKDNESRMVVDGDQRVYTLRGDKKVVVSLDEGLALEASRMKK